MTTVSNPTLVSSASNFTVYKNGDIYYAQTKTGAVSQNTNAADLINECIENLTASRTAKERVLLRGDFEIDDTIVMDSYTILQLDGKVTLADNADCYILSGDSKTQFEIIGGEWDGNRADQTAGTELKGFSFDTCTDFIIDNITLHDIYVHATSSAGDGIYCIDCSQAVIKNNTIYNVAKTATALHQGAGIIMFHCSDCQVRGNTIYDSLGHGIAFRTTNDSIAELSERNIINNNIIHDTYMSGLVMQNDESGTDYVRYNIITDNIIYNCATNSTNRMIEYSAEYGTIASNVFYETTGHTSAGGIYCNGGYNTINGNKFYNTGGNAIVLGWCYNSVISNNCINTTRVANSAGIHIDTCDHNVIIGNTIDAPKAEGIHLTSGGDENIITGNTIENPGTDWIYIDNVACEDNSILGNNLMGTSGAAGLAIHDHGTTTVIGVDNVNYTNEATGTATILNGATSVAVTHGLINATTKLTPTKMVATGSSADTAALYIDTIGDTTFTINVAIAVGGNRTVYWYAKV